MRAWSVVGRLVGAGLLSVGAPVSASAQAPGAAAPANPPQAAIRLGMSDAVRLAVEHNHQLLAQRLNVDISRAVEITAALKPNPVLTSTNENFPVFSPSQLTWDNIA